MKGTRGVFTMNKKGILIVISGFSGAGKGTVVKDILSRYDDYAVSISATTRSPREGEADGREYFFKTKEEFEAMIAAGELIEYAQYVGNYYGTPRRYVEEQLAAGRNMILEIEIQGALNIKKLFPEAVLLFITPPTASELEARLRGRGTEDDATVRARMARAAEEAKGLEAYDYIVVNDTVCKCSDTIDAIVKSEKNKSSNQAEFINDIKRELDSVYSEGV
jgi:guanylate kinase